MKNARYNSADVKKCCENKLNIGFRESKEFNGWFMLDDRKVARITVPKGKKSIPPGTYKSMASQLKITVSDFDDLLECPLDRNKYEIILRAKL